MNPIAVLKQYFGYTSFKPGQEDMVRGILAGNDVLGIMPTGAGKSICYQLPALLLPGITLVVSPLISLMRDQVRALNELGIHAVCLNSSLSFEEMQMALAMAADDVYKIIYVAPERLENPQFLRFITQKEVSMVTVDEAHCISQWGQDFRPSYLRIPQFIARLPHRPIVSAFTATATPEVKNDILCILGLDHPVETTTGFDRPNLYFQVEHTKRKADYVLHYVKAHPSESGIIYCATRKNVEEVTAHLISHGIDCGHYHAGMDSEERKTFQDAFIRDELSVIVATNAFGMGIDKPDVRYVIHYNMPQSMENYYQEAGRAGRDGDPARCILLFSAQDLVINRFLLDHKDFSEMEPEDIALITERDHKRLQQMERYCKTTECLRNTILRYFGEKPLSPCDHCGNCKNHYEEVDMTWEAKQVLNCVYEAKGRYGQTVIIGTLLGAKRARLEELKTVSYKTYGILKDLGENRLRELVSKMLEEGFLIQTAGRYSLLQLGDYSFFRNDHARFLVKMPKQAAPEPKKATAKKQQENGLSGEDYGLFEALRELRLSLARQAQIAPYMIFSNRTLVAMCLQLPKNKADMLAVSGVGENKLEKYGDAFLACIRDYRSTHPDFRKKS